MSRLAESWAGRRLEDVERLRERCPVCGGRRRCSVREDGLLVVCYREASSKDSADGGWIHYLSEPSTTFVERSRALPPEFQRAPDNVLDHAYRAVLEHCGLSREHREALRKRGLLDVHIERAGYAALPVKGGAAVARAMVAAVGEDNARRVPGYVVRDVGGKRWADVSARGGLLVPCRDLAGRILGLQIRRDNPGPEQGRYAWLSSRYQGGAPACSFAHVPVFPSWDRAEVVITEGPIKADVSCVLTGRFVVAIPGVSAWQRAVDLCTEVKPRLAWVALDADVAVNRHVAAALAKLEDGLRAAGVEYRVLRWPLSEAKGLDDLLAKYGDGFERAVAWTNRKGGV